MRLTPRARLAVELVCVVALLAGGLYVRRQLPADRNWRYAGSDSYGYMNLAHEWREHGRYALGPPPEPLAYSRVPGYPAFLALTFPTTNASASWDGLLWAQQLLDLLTALLVWLMARRLAGPVAGVVGCALACFNPFTPPFCAAMLTEILATTLTTAAAAAILLGAARPTRWWLLAGALLAASALVRVDGLILGIAFLPGVAAIDGTRARLRAAGAAAIGFVVVFAPWPLRNLVRFGRPVIAAGDIDRFSRPMQAGGYIPWLRSWAPDWNQQTFPETCFYEPGCPSSNLHLRARGAYVDLDDERAVDELLALRDRRGVTPEVSDGFAKLASARLHAHPFRVAVVLPLSRAWHMWVDSFDELYQGRLPWPSVMRHVRGRTTRDYATVQFFATLIAAAWLLSRRKLRVAAATLALPIVVRTVILAWTFYCMPRYSIEVMPLAWTLEAVAAVTLVAYARDFVRARRRSAA